MIKSQSALHINHTPEKCASIRAPYNIFSTSLPQVFNLWYVCCKVKPYSIRTTSYATLNSR